MIIQVKVYPHSGRETISPFTQVKTFGEKTPELPTYNVYLKKPAEDNKANLELLKILKKEFGKNARIVKGFTSRNKIIELSD